MRKILHKLMVDITRHPRRVVEHGRDFEWSDELWTHNIFRVYEYFFGAPYGVRPSVASWANKNGSGQIALCFEGQVALFEVWLRGVFKKYSPKLVVIPQLQLAGFNQQLGILPYRFAIGFDTATAAGSPPKSSNFTWTHVCTGSNLTFTSGGGTNAASTTSPTAKYNGSSLTVFTLQNTTSWGYVGYLAGASSGSHTAEANDSVATEWAVNGLSLTGTTASPSSPGSTTAKATSTSPSFTVTTTAANSWVVTACWCTNATFGTTTTGTNQTSRSTSQDIDSGFSAAISSQTTTTTGNYTSGWTITSALWIGGAVEVQAGAAAVVNSGFFFAAGAM